MNAPSAAQPSALSVAHVLLMSDLRRLRECASPGAGTTPEALLRELEAARRHVAEHFRLEEQGGYLGAVKRQGPGQERAIAELVADHRRLEQDLAALIAEAQAAPAPDPLGKKVLDWVGRLRDHEIRENELVQDAFNWDVAGED